MDIEKSFAINYMNLLADSSSFKSFIHLPKDTKDFSVLCGTCSISTLPCVLIIMNRDFKLGTMGYDCGENITLAFEKAIYYRLPVVCVIVSGGARVHDGVSALMQMAKTSAIVKKHSEAGLLYISVITNPTLGGVSASFASLADIIIAEPDATYGFTGKRIVAETVNEPLPPDFQSSWYAKKNGMVDMIIDRHNMKEQIGNLLYLHKNSININFNKRGGTYGKICNRMFRINKKSRTSKYT